MLKLRYYPAVILLLSVFTPATAPAAVSLAFADTDGTNNGSVTVAPNGTFTVRLNLVSVIVGGITDRPAGIDYYLNMLGSGSGLFQITDRNMMLNATTSSVYSDSNVLVEADVETLPSALLDPQNDHNLGATVSNLNQTYTAGTFFVAFYTLKVDPATPLATYSLQTISEPGTGWSDPDFVDHEFSGHANYSIVVVPEPASMALLAGGAVMLLGRRRGALCVRRLERRA